MRQKLHLHGLRILPSTIRQMPRLIIAIRDNLANDITGPVMLVRHEAQAIRTFSDIATDPNTTVHRHVADYDVLQLGTLSDEDLTIDPSDRVIITGAAWLAAQESNKENSKQ